METCPVCGGSLSSHDAKCPACGFRLAGATQEFKPITLEADVSVQPQAERRIATMTVVRGPQNLSTTYTLDRPEMYIGRSPKCDIFLNDMTVSRDHAVLLVHDEQVIIRDDDSFNGVWINNSNVGEASLRDGDIVQIGAFCLQFSM